MLIFTKFDPCKVMQMHLGSQTDSFESCPSRWDSVCLSVEEFLIQYEIRVRKRWGFLTDVTCPFAVSKRRTPVPWSGADQDTHKWCCAKDGRDIQWIHQTLCSVLSFPVGCELLNWSNYQSLWLDTIRLLPDAEKAEQPAFLHFSMTL